MNPRALTDNSWRFTGGPNLTTYSADDLAHNCNLMNNLMVDVGLIRLTNTQFTGQSGVATSSTTPTEGETQVRPDAGGWGDYPLVIWAYKHPTLDLYVKVTWMYTRYPHSNVDSMYAKCECFFQIENGAPKGSKYEFTNYLLNGNGLNWIMGQQLRGTGDVHAYCDDNGFWISIAPIIKNSYPIGDNKAFCANANVSQFAMMAQRDLENNMMMIGHPQLTFANDSDKPLAGASVHGRSGVLGTSMNVWWYDLVSKNLYKTNTSYKPFETLPHPHVANLNGQVRVFQAETLHINETLSTFNFGTVNEGAMAHGAQGLMDLTGSGSPTLYVANKSFGPILPLIAQYPSYQAENSYLQLLLPWVE